MKKSPSTVVSDLQKWAHDSGFSYAFIAKSAGVNLSTVYRILDPAADHKRVGSAMKAICKFAEIDIHVSTTSEVPAVLRSAVLDAWDGSDHHAMGLARAIRAIGPLVCSASKRS